VTASGDRCAPVPSADDASHYAPPGRPAAEKRVVPWAVKAANSSGEGRVFRNASARSAVGAHWGNPAASRSSHCQPVGHAALPSRLQGAHGSSTKREAEDALAEAARVPAPAVAELHRATHSLTQVENATGGSDGHIFMHGDSAPPGQPAGVGEGEGEGEGDGEGEGPPATVEPISPKRMFEYVTCESGCCDSTRLGAPEVVAHEPRASPGFVPLTG